MTAWLWAGFIAFILVMLALDLFLLHRGSREIRAREALAWTGVCIALALLFNVAVYFIYEGHWLGIGLHTQRHGGVQELGGADAALQFFTGWLVEYSLSVDNIFVIAVIFTYFRVPRAYQHRVLFWGILGALVMRGGMIAAGTALINRLQWTLYFFAAVLLYSAARMLLTREQDIDPERGWVLRTARRLLPVSPAFEGDRFFTRIDGRWVVTPLFLVLLAVETTDIVFAVDSIPAILGITQDPFLVFTSNIFAILGLRSLYFALAAIIDKFRYLKLSLVFVLAFVAVKMFLDHTPAEFSTQLSLAVIGAILAGGVAASLAVAGREKRRAVAPIDDLALAGEHAWKRARRVVILVIGITVIILSVPIGLLPGPGGIFVALAGLAILATEFLWARRLLNNLRQKAQGLSSRAEGIVPRSPRLVIIPVAWGALLIALSAGLYAFPVHWKLLIWWGLAPAAALLWWTLAVVRRWRAQRSRPQEDGGPPSPLM